jgi:hypothetical protein
MSSRAHIGENEVLEVKLFDRPHRIEDRFVVANDQCALALGVAPLDDLPVRRKPQPVAARRAEAMVDGEQLVHLARYLDARRDEDDEVITNSFNVGTRWEERTMLTP